MITDISKYGQFYGGNSLVTSGQNECGEPRLYPNNAYYRFNKLRDEGDWPSNISGIYYGKGDCINCPKSNLKNFKDFSLKEFEGEREFILEGSTNQETLQNHKITDINQFLMQNSNVATADIHYKFLGPVFQRLIVGYQVFWPMQGYQDPTVQFNTDYVNSESFSRGVGIISSDKAANRPGVGEWTREYNNGQVEPWGAMKRKIMGDFGSPSISQITKTNMGAWFWPERNNSFQWYINSNFNGPPKMRGFESGFNKKFSELRIIFDSCSVSNIENRVRVSCPSPGSHIFAGESTSASAELEYYFHPDADDNRGLVGCFVEYFALIFTDKEKDTLNVIQKGIVQATGINNYFDVSNSSTFNDLLQEYGLNIQGGHNISGEATVEITGFGLPRSVNINLCSHDYHNVRLNNYLNLFQPSNGKFNEVFCTDGASIYTALNKTVFRGINVASGVLHPWNEKQGLWTSGHYLDPPFYLGNFLMLADGRWFRTILNNSVATTSPAGYGRYLLGHIKNPPPELGVVDPGHWGYDPNFYPNYPNSVDDDGRSFYSFTPYKEWFCSYGPGGNPVSRGYIRGQQITISNMEYPGEFLVPYRPLYFLHGYVSALLTIREAQGQDYCGDGSPSYLNPENICNEPFNQSRMFIGGYSLINSPFDTAHLGKFSIAGPMGDWQFS
jgi:hypothetical protein